MTIFTDQAEAIAELRSDKLALLPDSYINGAALSDDTLWRKLLQAEQQVSRLLTVPLEPTYYFPLAPPTSDQLAEIGSSPWFVEPGYDMEGGFLGSLWNWGTIKLRRSPLIEVQEIKFVFPGLNAVVYTVPPDWIYPDARSGILQFTPAPTPAGLPPSIVAANMVAMGTAVPQMIRIRYSAGLTPQHDYFLDVRDLVLRGAVLRVLTDAMLPQSASISADGLSQSQSLDISKMQDAFNEQAQSLKEAILGPVFMVL